MTISSDIFNLIKSLTKAEKRHLKLIASLQKGNKKYLDIFDAIDYQAKNYTQYNENKIIQKLKKKGIPTSFFSYAKNYLTKTITYSLNNLYSKSSTDSLLANWLIDIEISYNKNLNKQCLSLIKKAKTIAKQFERWAYYINICNWEIKEYYKSYDFTSVEKINLELQQANEYHKTYIDYCILRNKLQILYNQKGILKIRNKEAEKMLKSYMAHPLLSERNTPSTFLSIIIYYSIKEKYYRSNNNFIKYQETVIKRMSLFEKNKHFISDQPTEYLNAIDNYNISLFELKQYNKVPEAIEKMKNIFKIAQSAITPHLKSIIDLEIITTTLSYNNRIGNHEAVIKTYKDMLAQEEELSQIKKGAWIVAVYNTALSCISSNNYEEALAPLNKLLNIQKNDGLREDIFSMSLLLTLITHYELENDRLLEYSVQSAYRQLLKKQKLFKTEEAIVKFLKRSLKFPPSKLKHSLEFKKLYEELKVILRNPYEQKFLEYFDILKWLETK